MFNIWPNTDYKKCSNQKGGYLSRVKEFFKKEDTRYENEKLFDHLYEKGCVDCGCKDFLEGPSGGIAQNVKCANDECGSKYNIMPMGWAERI